MSIQGAILGFLSWKPFTGYELKKIFADALSFHWSGNNNQIYSALIELHRGGAVSMEVRHQEKLPSRKVYAITPKGREELHAWLLSESSLPIVRDEFVARLAWAASLPRAEFEGIVSNYEAQIKSQVLLYGERIRRGGQSPGRTSFEAALWKSMEEHALSFYEAELEWLGDLRALDWSGLR